MNAAHAYLLNACEAKRYPIIHLPWYSTTVDTEVTRSRHLFVFYKMKRQIDACFFGPYLANCIARYNGDDLLSLPIDRNVVVGLDRSERL